jgi:iron transport multicopper oxidase
VLNNLDSNKHPFHLHGHNFQAISRSEDNAGSYDPTNATQNKFPQFPMRRDTFMVRPVSNFVLRFRADNPGIWLYHCHIEWHTAVGLIATLVEAPLDLQQSLTVPEDHFKVCQAQAIPTAGNAAGNTVDLFDLAGENAPPPPLPAGFTAKGIVALVFSCVSAFLGMAVITWYGLVPITNQRINEGGVVEGNGHVSSNGSAEEVSGAMKQVSEVPKTG